MLRRIERDELSQIISARQEGESLDLSNCLFEKLDLSGWDFHHINFDKSDFRDVNLKGADFSGCSASNTFFQGSCLKDVKLRDASLHSADFRHCNLSGADLSGADIFAAALHGADLTGVTADERTKYYYPRCPMEGAFIGWKVCYGRRSYSCWCQRMHGGCRGQPLRYGWIKRRFFPSGQRIIPRVLRKRTLMWTRISGIVRESGLRQNITIWTVLQNPEEGYISGWTGNLRSLIWADIKNVEITFHIYTCKQ